MSHDPLHAVMLAQSLLRENKPEAALVQLQRLVSKHPQDPRINSLLASVHLRLGSPEKALFFAQRAADIAPDIPGSLTNLGIVLMACGKEASAIPVLRKALDQRPSDQEATLSLANAALLQRRAGEALDLCRQGLAFGWHAQLAVSCGASLLALGDYAEAMTFIKEGLAKSPNEIPLAAQLPPAMVASPGVDPDVQAEAHRAFGRMLTRAAGRTQSTYVPIKDPARKLRIGLVSPDLRQHSVAYFIEPFLEQYDRDSLEVICYSTNPAFDDISRRLKAHAALWRNAAGLSDEALSALVSRDRVDIAIDLAGLTHGHRLGAFAARIAPIQVTYLGYPDTTGLPAMDYRIVDSHTDPRGTDSRCTERLVRLDPVFLCWRPPTDSPAAPRQAPDRIAFGSFNDTRKYNPKVAALWGRVLDACPTAVLKLKSLNFCDPAVVQRTMALLAASGIGPERVEVLGPSASVAEHLHQYSGIDIALDPIPYNGTTTTCEALWMGVPVVTLAGNRHAGRVGVSLLTNVGTPELIAKDEDDYVRIASSLATDKTRFAGYRSGLRSCMASSPLCDRAGFARRFGDALRGMWREYCAK